MVKSTSLFRTLTIGAFAIVIALACVFGLAACGETPLYKVDFNGTVGDDFKTEYQLKGTTWTESDQEGFEKVYTLTGTVPYNAEFATLPNMRYDTLDIWNFAVIHISSEEIAKVAYNKKTGEGFYAKITNNYGTDKAETVVKHGSFGAKKDDVDSSYDYYLFQGIDNTVKTLSIEISFDGTAENAKTYLFVIDPENYELEAAPTAQE